MDLGLGLDNLFSQPLTQTTEPTTGETNTVNEDKAAIKTNNETKDQPTSRRADGSSLVGKVIPRFEVCFQLNHSASKVERK